MDPAEAVARPRKMILNDGETLAIEADYPGAAEMARSDPRVMLMPPRHHSFGHAHAILIDGPGEWRAGADPRSDGSVEYGR
jgi:gamma-glutamyltranspeptidase